MNQLERYEFVAVYKGYIRYSHHFVEVSPVEDFEEEILFLENHEIAPDLRGHLQKGKPYWLEAFGGYYKCIEEAEVER